MAKFTVLEKIYNQISKDMGIPKGKVRKIYEVYWGFIKEKIGELPLKNCSLTQEEFESLPRKIDVHGLGHFYCDFGYHKLMGSIKKREQVKKNNQNKRDYRRCKRKTI